MLSRKLIKLVKNVACSAAVLSGTVLAVQSQVNAETFQIGGFGLNTNNNFSRIDGQPKMSSWQTNPNDNDQQFDRLSGRNGAFLLKHRSTGKCVNAYRGNGFEFNVWPCNANDGDQNWNIINLGGGKVQLQKVGTNLCIDMPERRNYGRVHMIVCDRNNGNQQWVSSNGGGQPQPQPQNPYYHNFEAFVNFARGQVGIARLDTNDLKGQCVTLIARYVQEVYLTGADRTKSYAFGNGKDTANVVGSQSPFNQFFLPATNQGLPKRGAVISFPDLGRIGNVNYGHTAIVMNARTVNGQRQVQIMDSNGDGKAPNTTVREYSYWINIPDGRGQGYGNNIYWANPR